MYSIYYDGSVLYDPRDESRDIRDASARISVVDANNADSGELKFTIQEDHPEFSRLKRMSGIMELRQDDAPVFRGRIAHDVTDMDLAHQIVVESAFAFLNDSVVPPFTFPDDFTGISAYQSAAASGGNVVEYFLGWILGLHNDQTSTEQALRLGTVTVTDPNNYMARGSDSYQTCLDVIKNDLLGELGGYIVLRYVGGLTYIDYLASLPGTNAQPVEFAKNLLDVSREIDGTDIFNAILPVGADGLTISGLSDGDVTADIVKAGKIIYSRNGRAGYTHRITRIIEYSDVTTAADLLTKAAAEMEAHGGAAVESITCKAVDLAYADGFDVEAFRVGRMTSVISGPHGLNASYPLTEINIPDLKEPGSTEITLGIVAATLSAAVHR